MKNGKKSFIEEYVALFLELVNYDSFDNSLKSLEERRTMMESFFEKKYPDDVQLQNDKKKYFNDMYDKELFNYIREEVADRDPEFFRIIIDDLNNLLNLNSDLANSVGMKLNTDNYKLTFSDYYNNYLIALEELLKIKNSDSMIEQ